MIHIKETEIIPLLKEAQTEYSQKITEGDPKDVEMAERIIRTAPTSFSGSTSSAGSHHWNAVDCKASQITGQRNWG